MILHVDADAFFCQVERRRNPALAGCPALAVQQHQDVIGAPSCTLHPAPCTLAAALTHGAMRSADARRHAQH